MSASHLPDGTTWRGPATVHRLARVQTSESAPRAPDGSSGMPSSSAVVARTPSLRDLDVEGGRIQAKWELDRALDQGEDRVLARWARCWGPEIRAMARRFEAERADLERRIDELQTEAVAELQTEAVHTALLQARLCLETLLAKSAVEREAISDHLARALSHIDEAGEAVEQL